MDTRSADELVVIALAEGPAAGSEIAGRVRALPLAGVALGGAAPRGARQDARK